MPYANTGGLLEDLRPRECEQLYVALTKRFAVDTHRNALATAKAFGTWCVKQDWIATSPLADVTAIGQRNRGKKQLRIDEARKLVDLCIRRANEGDEGAVGVLTAFLMGMRASEVTDRVVRDLDDAGRLLWIELGKTKRSRRTIEVPALLRPYLLALAKGRAPDAQLISRTISKRSGKKRDRYWLLYHVERLCTDAEVPVVCTHSLRGLHATVATEAGATSHVVASALGHSSPAVTHAHYIEGATARRVRARRVISKVVAPEPTLRVVGGAAAAEPAADRPAITRRTNRKGAPEPVLHVVSGDPNASSTTDRRPRTRRASRKTAPKPGLRVVSSEPGLGVAAPGAVAASAATATSSSRPAQAGNTPANGTASPSSGPTIATAASNAATAAHEPTGSAAAWETGNAR